MKSSLSIQIQPIDRSGLTLVPTYRRRRRAHSRYHDGSGLLDRLLSWLVG